MLEGLLESFLIKYFGDFIENLDKNKLSIGIWSGSLLLEDIVIKTKSIDKFKLPFTLIFGKIGKLEVKLPWKSNFSEPTIVNIESVQVVVTLIEENKWEQLDYISYDSKIKSLLSFANNKFDEIKLALEKKESSYSDRVLLKILDNLHLNFKNLHIRIEESNFKPYFAFGITMHSLNIVNTD